MNENYSRRNSFVIKIELSLNFTLSYKTIWLQIGENTTEVSGKT